MAAAVFLAVSCDSLSGFGNQTGDSTENKDDQDGPDTPDDPTPLTPEENRAKLEQIGMDVVAMATPDRQANLLSVIDQFYKLTCDYPIDFKYELNKPSYRKISPQDPISAVLGAIKAFCESKNPYMLSKVTKEESYFYEAPRAYGIYEFNNNKWSYTKSDDKLSVIFPYNGETVEATISASGKNYKYEYDDEWNSSGYNDGGHWVNEPVTNIDHVFITVPAHIEASVTLGSTELFNLEVDGEYNTGSGPVNQTLSLNAGSYDVDMTLEVTDIRVSQAFSFDIDGPRLLTTEVYGEGTHLCDVDYYRDNIEDMFAGAKAHISVLDLDIEANSTDISAFLTEYDRMNDEAYEWDNPDELEPESKFPPTWASEEYVSDLCDLMNNTFTVEASYGSASPFADFWAKPMYENDLYCFDKYLSDNDYGSYHLTERREFNGFETTYIIKFRNDGAEYEVMDFFNENDYASVVDAVKELIDRYEYYLNYIFNY